MERLDVYDENMNFIRSEDRDIVHQKGLWHKTIHCWLYDKSGNIYFQIRSDSNKLYTSASGHVLAGESLAKAFRREVREEIGMDVDTKNASLAKIYEWRMDKIKNGIPFIDRAFTHAYINVINTKSTRFTFDESEVLGLVKVNAKKCLQLFNGETNEIEGVKITNTSKKINLKQIDFLFDKSEIEPILQSVINATAK